MHHWNRITCCCLLGFSLLTSCHSIGEPAESGFDLGRRFISAVNSGNFKLAGKMISDDPATKAFFNDSLMMRFREMNSFTKDSISNLPIHILEVEESGDSTYLDFEHNYDGRPAQLIILKEGEGWKVDLSNRLKKRSS